MKYTRQPPGGEPPPRRTRPLRHPRRADDPAFVPRVRLTGTRRERRLRSRRYPADREEPYRGPGPAGRYGGAPVPYGPDHTYDFHFGDHYGYGPDYRLGEERIRRASQRRGPRRDYESW